MKMSSAARVQKRDTCGGNMSRDRLPRRPQDNKDQKWKSDSAHWPSSQTATVYPKEMINDGDKL